MDYEEKLRLAKEALESGSYDTETIEYIFPELRESEDEKIRDEICIYIGAKQDISLDMHNRWLTWLEKQGQKPTWSEDDEEFLRRAIKATTDVYPVTADWLKTLKERMKGE